MMAYAQLYGAPRLTLLYPHHPGLGPDDTIHARYHITGHTTNLETASIDVSDGSNSSSLLAKLRGLVVGKAETGLTIDETFNQTPPSDVI